MNSNHSLNNVKRIFENKTGVDLSAGRPAHRPVKAAVMLIAAIACCLTVSAFAINYLSEGALVKFFQRGVIGIEDNHNELSESQLLAIKNYTTYINERVESMGTILTIKSVTASISSGNLSAYFVLEMEAPDGVLDNIHDFDLAFKNTDLCFERGNENNSSSGGGSIEAVLDDEQGRDNVKTIVYAYHSMGRNYSSKELPVTLTFTNLCRWETGREKPYEGARLELDDLRVVMVEGEWSFDFDFGIFKESIELLNEPLLFEENEYTLTTLQISPLCLYLSMDYPQLEYAEDGTEAPLTFCNDMQIIMRDGSVIKTDSFDKYGRYVESENNNTMVGGGAVIGETRFSTSFKFDAPIDLGEVDYILFADGTRVDIQ